VPAFAFTTGNTSAKGSDVAARFGMVDLQRR